VLQEQEALCRTREAGGVFRRTNEEVEQSSEGMRVAGSPSGPRGGDEMMRKRVVEIRYCSTPGKPRAREQQSDAHGIGTCPCEQERHVGTNPSTSNCDGGAQSRQRRVGVGQQQLGEIRATNDAVRVSVPTKIQPVRRPIPAAGKLSPIFATPEECVEEQQRRP
jgi:hypothetical protein